MSLVKLKKDELQALFTANDLQFDPAWTKADLIEELEAADVTVDSEGSNDADAETSNSGVTRETKVERQKRLKDRFK